MFDILNQLSLGLFIIQKIPTYHVIILLNIKDEINVVFILAGKMVNCAAFLMAVVSTVRLLNDRE
ncbi:hypothetical protein Kalk_02685 [Ketobacter alkanivorans]|uniref:Uncharacterized protein n=1 Tax=Ketobacter alkanivorans TaxID=1917421 RepID=A0A2K9LKU7_9GAMM|nr:hypothetical protein Kalk_02685 [Ketobacter alkanivorans]